MYICLFTWHILGDRLIPEQPLWVDRGILHVGPTKSLTFSRGPKGCHVYRYINLGCVHCDEHSRAMDDNFPYSCASQAGGLWEVARGNIGMWRWELVTAWPRTAFWSMHVPPDLPTIGVPAIREIIYLAASTMDWWHGECWGIAFESLDILELRTLGKNEKRYVYNLKIESSNLLEKLRISTWDSSFQCHPQEILFKASSGDRLERIYTP